MKCTKFILILLSLAFVSLGAQAQQYNTPQTRKNLIHYQGEGVTGYGIGLGADQDAQFYVETIHGLRFSKNFFAGVGFGYNNAIVTNDYADRRYWESYFAVYLNLRYYFLFDNSPVSLFASMSGGYVTSMDYAVDGYSLCPALGISVKMRRNSSINISVGYDFQDWIANCTWDGDSFDNKALALRVGFSF